MTPLFERALGNQFTRLHPELRRRFGFTSDDGVAAWAHGEMDEIWISSRCYQPFLRFGQLRHVLVPEAGRKVPFTIENYAYRDELGRETLTFNRTFHFRRRRFFDATMIWSERTGRIVDYLGTHQHLAVDLDCAVDARGGLVITSSAQRFYAGPFGFTFPRFVTGTALLCEWFDEESGCFRIEVTVSNLLFGNICGYRGSFVQEWLSCPRGFVPGPCQPVQTERRE